MSDVFILYVSAAPDLRLEREVVGRALTEIPTSLGWKVSRTPGPGKASDIAALRKADLHVLLLGSDIQAPVGLEWLTARRAGRQPRLFLKSTARHTQAAQSFIRELAKHATWEPFEDAVDLRRRILRLLGDALLTAPDRYAFTDDEVDRLRAWHRALAGAGKRKTDDTLGGAGDSAVILSAERFAPSHGTLITAPGPSTRSTSSGAGR